MEDIYRCPSKFRLIFPFDIIIIARSLHKVTPCISTNYRRFFIDNRTLHPADFVAEHPLNFVVHGFPAGGAEMDRYSVCGFADFLHKRGAFVLLQSKRSRTVGSVNNDYLFIAHQ